MNFVNFLRICPAPVNSPGKHYKTLNRLIDLDISYFLVYHMSRYYIYQSRYRRFNATILYHAFSSLL